MSNPEVENYVPQPGRPDLDMHVHTDGMKAVVGAKIPEEVVEALKAKGYTVERAKSVAALAQEFRVKQKITVTIWDAEDDPNAPEGWNQTRMTIKWDPPLPEGGEAPKTPATAQLARMLGAIRQFTKSPEEQLKAQAAQQEAFDRLSKPAGKKLILPTAGGRGGKKRRK